jgi:hypothetical protein
MTEQGIELLIALVIVGGSFIIAFAAVTVLFELLRR